MPMTNDPTFTVEQAVKVQRDMRHSLGLAPEVFPLPAFIGMISDEIEQWRSAGRTDGEIVAMICGSTGHRISEADLVRFYAPPERRLRGDGDPTNPGR